MNKKWDKEEVLRNLRETPIFPIWKGLRDGDEQGREAGGELRLEKM